MISNGFQVRLLDGAFASIEETFALTPEVLSPVAPDTTLEHPQEQHSFPHINLSGYSPALRAKALGLVRKGAVYIVPHASNLSRSQAGTSGDEKAQTSAPHDHFYLAFRWIGPEHKNAENAGILDDIATANLQRICGVGLMQVGGAREEDRIAPRVSTPAAAKARSSLSASLLYARNMNKRASRALVECSPVKGPSFFAELYVDNQLIPMHVRQADHTDREPAEPATTLQLTDGALLDLGPLGLANPDVAVNTILHTLTLHLWDAGREDVPDEAGQDLKKTVPPTVVFHFEVISRGPQSTETAPPEKSSPSIAAQAVEQDGGLGSHDDGFPWAGGSARAKQLASVAEERSESSSQAILPSEQAEVSGLASSTGPGLTSLTRTSSLAAAPGVPEASKTRPSSVPPKTNRQPGMTSKVKVQDRSACDYASRNQAAMEPNGPSMLQRWCEKVTKARLGSCFRKAPYPLSPRRLQKHRSMEAPAGASVPYGRLRKALERAEELKHEWQVVEQEKKVLHEQRTRILIKSVDDEVSLWESRVQMGKREVQGLKEKLAAVEASVA